MPVQSTEMDLFFTFKKVLTAEQGSASVQFPSSNFLRDKRYEL
jgi:hypothetical protein